MNRFAALLDRLAYEPRRNGKLTLLAEYFRTTPDPDRGLSLAAMTGALAFRHAKPGIVRALAAERTDPVLFALSYDFVGDLSETVALMWEPRDHPLPEGEGSRALSLATVVDTLAAASKSDLPAILARLLDRLDETGRWALLKLITGALRIGVSARLARTALAQLGGRQADEVEDVWHAVEPPYADLFAWIEGRGPRPHSGDPASFRPPMLAHALEETDLAGLDPAAYLAEWKWDGIRVQAAAGRRADGRRTARLFSRTGDDISASFPELVERFAFEAAIDGELLVHRDGRVQSFNALQQRLNRKLVTPKVALEFPAMIRAYDLLAVDGQDLRPLSFLERRRRLEAFLLLHPDAPFDLSPLVPFPSWEALAAARVDPAAAGAGADAQAVEGLMVKRAESPYLPGRPKGHWWKWKRDPHVVDAVLMYAQRGHGKRSSFYSDYTFGVWRAGETAEELVPVGKAYFGFTDEELLELDRFVRRHTVNRFGPVREVAHAPDFGLVLEVAFEGLQRSTRHKSGIAMRFPRIARIRWDKPPREADRIEALEALLARAGAAATEDAT